MKINAIKLRIIAAQGEFGFLIPFGRGLTIIRGNNSSGKSTVFLSLLYGMGMEEIAGGKNELVLPYAVKKYFTYGGRDIEVIASEVYVEVENEAGQAVTFRRSIKDHQKSSKLIEILDGAVLTKSQTPTHIRPTYLHDSGGAQKAEGFHNFLEQFLGYKLPSVPTTSGGETRLYLQAIFAALAVEQKRGWTDYIANIPFFGIRDARTRVVEFLLGLDVFETNAKRNRLNSESVEIGILWDKGYQRLHTLVNEIGVVIQGVPTKVTSLFNASLVQINKRIGHETVPLPSYIGTQREEYARLNLKATVHKKSPSHEVQEELDSTTKELQRLTNLYETASATEALQQASVNEYEQLFKEAEEDLTRNRTVRKLRTLGATTYSIEVASDRCPTCHQHVEDSILAELIDSPQMDLETNISYLEKQARMLDRQIAGGRQAIAETAGLLRELSKRTTDARVKLNALRSDLVSDATVSRAIMRQQIQIEIEIERLQRAESEISEIVAMLASIAVRLRNNQSARAGLPKEYYSDEDLRKIRVFEKQFRANASSFEYKSARIDDIRINDDTLIPYLANMELREIGIEPARLKALKAQTQTGTDIKADSSASDFVRLILSYLLALHQASSLPNGGGRHPGLILLDEPGQHSMAQSSQRALLQILTANPGLQGIVAASFDESPEVFREVTEGVEFTLIELGEKSICPL
ncbi:hypothetical protein F2P46_16790 [Massilia sp. CCM 8734]|nr:ATP-binding protein [Massilia sp. CCM 8734]NHZ97364.1 hypothetical protein [Massilia sp. CCM 8734]